MSINVVTLSGNLTRDCEEKPTASGSLVTFTVAVNDRRKNQRTGEWEDYPNYINCTIFGRRADALKGRLKKGAKVCVTGKLRYSKWTDRDGKNRTSIDVAVDDIDMLFAKNQPSSARENDEFAPIPDAYSDEDMPF